VIEAIEGGVNQVAGAEFDATIADISGAGPRNFCSRSASVCGIFLPEGAPCLTRPLQFAIAARSALGAFSAPLPPMLGLPHGSRFHSEKPRDAVYVQQRIRPCCIDPRRGEGVNLDTRPPILFRPPSVPPAGRRPSIPGRTGSSR